MSRFDQHVPDILDCLAQLSNDEVPTSPKLARAMLDLLPEHVWHEPDYRWLDPFSKSGVFLREIATRLLDGLTDWEPDFAKRREHIFRNMLYGAAITEMTGIISRRSVYCAADASSAYSVVRFDDPAGNIPYVLSVHDFDADGKCRICRAPESIERGEGRENHAYSFIHDTYPTQEMAAMKFDVIVGNPPYHLEDGGHGTSATNLYHLFVDKARELNPRYITMIIPSRWFGGGKGLDSFRDSLLNDNRLRSITDYLSASDPFPGVGLKGGVSYFLWDRDNPGECTVTTRYKDWPVSVATRPLLEPGVDVFIRFNEGVAILKKVMSVETGATNMLALPDEKNFGNLVSSRKPFGLSTKFKGHSSKEPGDLKLYRNGGTSFVGRDELLAGADLVDAWKIYVGRAAPGTGNKDTYPHRVISTPFKGEPRSASSETYLCVGPFANESEVDSALSYLQCRLPRFLIQLRKASQDTTRRVYASVPLQTWDRAWTDADLYAKYGLNDDEIAFIESIVRPLRDGSTA
ncbi:Eco57I restriction-modification methylase domain-containing protein [Gordonia alkaliphila]|uniref:Eco57I restriction-modification methylase domain-containing protein n=1 Tax=Gordonia alkaliphila TaxID=1053547 RepID=UPI001FF625C4|nr:Eco57I restriction-modification methylase domain-containing protein [Gordonia alkaliphila]MCK0440313.1 Eco57I restriction-modification methylase domain-containing protein [Gordonia alkaliphila]